LKLPVPSVVRDLLQALIGFLISTVEPGGPRERAVDSTGSGEAATVETSSVAEIASSRTN
jgi:hypothetical protein